MNIAAFPSSEAKRPGYRRRHVKCDESKPACQRCIKWRGHCDGYEQGRGTKSLPPESIKENSKSPTPDSEKAEVPKWYPSLATESNKLLGRSYEVCVSRDPRRREAMAGEASGTIAETSSFDDGFWEVVVPHLLRQQASVWYANLAIHALIDAKRPSWDDEGGDHAGASYRRALRYHGLALGQLRKEAISRGSLQSATLCCLFFVIFEMMNGDHEAAQAHMFNGCKMMGELQRDSQGRLLPSSEIEGLLHIELRKALQFVGLQVSGPGEDMAGRATDGDYEMLGDDSGISVETGAEWFDFGFQSVGDRWSSPP